MKKPINFVVDLPEAIQLKDQNEPLWEVFLWCFALEEALLIVGSVYALLKAC